VTTRSRPYPVIKPGEVRQSGGGRAALWRGLRSRAAADRPLPKPRRRCFAVQSTSTNTVMDARGSLGPDSRV